MPPFPFFFPFPDPDAADQQPMYGRPSAPFDPSALLAPFGLEFRQPPQNVLFGNRPFAQRHPRIAGGLEGALLALANLESGDTTGENLTNVARSIVGAPRMKRNLQIEAMMAPFQAVDPILNLMGKAQQLQTAGQPKPFETPYGFATYDPTQGTFAAGPSFRELFDTGNINYEQELLSLVPDASGEEKQYLAGVARLLQNEIDPSRAMQKAQEALRFVQQQREIKARQNPNVYEDFASSDSARQERAKQYLQFQSNLIEGRQRPPAPRQPAPASFRVIESKKQKALAEAEKDFRDRRKGPLIFQNFPELERRKQEAQRIYEEELTSLTGDEGILGSFGYDAPPPPEAAPRKNPYRR